MNDVLMKQIPMVYETNPNRQRDHIDPTSPLRNFVCPISFHDSRERESFLQYIDHLISSSTSPEATSCLTGILNRNPTFCLLRLNDCNVSLATKIIPFHQSLSTPSLSAFVCHLTTA